MNAHNHSFPTNNPEAIARSVMTGCASLLPAVDHEYYDFGEWHEAADDALEAGDFTKFAKMLATEVCRAEYHEWQRQDYDRRQYEDFGAWVQARANWGDDYALAAQYAAEIEAANKARYALFLDSGLRRFGRAA